MNIIITGYYKKNNLGDDLFEKIASKIFSQKDFKKQIKSYKTVNIDDITSIENRTFCDRVILFGGETLNNYFLDKLIELYRLNPSIKFNAIGVSCNQDYNSLINKLYIFESIIFRNKKDYNNLSLYNLCTYSSDIVFLKNIKNNIVFNKFLKKNIIGFFLSQTVIYNLTYEKEFKYISFLVNLIRYWIKLDYKIYLFAMCTNNINSENDIIINHKILNHLSEHEKKYIKAYSTNKKVMSKINILKYAICWRFHAHILCTMYNIPFISISNTPKVNTYLDENNLNDLQCDMHNYEDKLNYLLSNENNIKNKLLEIYKKNRCAAKIYTKTEYYFMNKKDNTFYIDKKTFEYIYNKLKDFYNKYKTNDNYFNAQIVIFFLMRTLENEYIYGLNEKIYMGLDKLKDDIYWLINDCIIRKNLMFYESVSELLNKNINDNKCINIKYLDQNDYKDLHRAGWQYVVDNITLLTNEKSINMNNIICDLNVDRTFHWNYTEYTKLDVIPYKKNWIGFIHHTCNINYSTYNTVNLFKKKLFLESLKYCCGLIVLSDHLKSQIESLLNEYKFNVKVYTLYHPTEFVSDEFMFTPKKFTLAIKKKIIQIGAWMRNMNGINKLNVDSSPLFLDKYVLVGKKMDSYYVTDENSDKEIIYSDNDNLDDSDNYSMMCNLNNSINNYYNMNDKNDKNYNNLGIITETSFNITLSTYSNITLSSDNISRKIHLHKNVYVIKHLQNNDYDKLLSESLIFLNLIDASAVNTVIECIVRNTPIYVNRLPALEEILGNKYPLFYDNINDVSNMLTMDYIDKAYSYLKNLNKDKFKIDFFMKKFRETLKNINININNKLEKENNDKTYSIV